MKLQGGFLDAHNDVMEIPLGIFAHQDRFLNSFQGINEGGVRANITFLYPGNNPPSQDRIIPLDGELPDYLIKEDLDTSRRSWRVFFWLTTPLTMKNLPLGYSLEKLGSRNRYCTYHFVLRDAVAFFQSLG